jgi:hypothetical protein
MTEETLFVWGRRRDGQLGLGYWHNRLTPTLVRKESFDWSMVLMVARSKGGLKKKWAPRAARRAAGGQVKPNWGLSVRATRGY